MTKEWKVPFVNYKQQYQVLKEELDEAYHRVMERGDFILRQDVEEFEENFAKFLGAKYAIGVNSCTDAMKLSLKVAGIGQGQYVITSSHTFLATLDAIVDVGAMPILVDSGHDHNMDTNLLTEEILEKSSAIMPVHLNGRCCKMDDIINLANHYSLAVVEDAAQAMGASYKGQKAGTFGTGTFSFFPAKILGTAGDGGMVTTNSRDFADKIRAMRDYGRIKGQEQVMGYGYNSRLDNLHAAILNVKLKYVSQWIQRRRDIANQYGSYLRDILKPEGLAAPPSESYMTDYHDVYQNYVIRVDAQDRDGLVKFLIDNGIEVLVSWRTPLHKQVNLGLGHYHLPITEAICDEVISLPMYPELTDKQVEYVCKKVRDFYKR